MTITFLVSSTIMFTSKKKSALKVSLDPNNEIFLQYFLLLHHINYHLENNIPDLFPSAGAYSLAIRQSV
jgi:hypothetical protein